jgi:hypothetical protein
MPSATKKLAKSGRAKATVKRSKPQSGYADAPVLFCLPDLTTISQPPPALANPLIGSQISVASGQPQLHIFDPEASETPSIEAQPVPPPKPPKLLQQTSRLAQRWVVPSSRRMMQWALRAYRIPYIAPAGLLSASLLITLALIYAPWNKQGTGSKATADSVKTNLASSPSTASAMVAPSRVEVEIDSVANSNSLPLKKIATDLDEQLSPDDSPEVSIAAAVEPNADMEDGASSDESFTEPWWRTKPAKSVRSHYVAEDSDQRGQGDAEMMHEAEAESVLEESMAQSQRIAHRETRRMERSEEWETEEQDPIPERPRSSSSRYSAPTQDSRSSDAPRRSYREEESFERNRTLEDENEDPPSLRADSIEEDAPVSPWRTVRNERLQRETPRTQLPPRESRLEYSRSEELEESDATAANKPQYRSPPGQDFDWRDDSQTQTAARPRNESKRSGLR